MFPRGSENKLNLKNSLETYVLRNFLGVLPTFAARPSAEALLDWMRKIRKNNPKMWILEEATS